METTGSKLKTRVIQFRATPSEVERLERFAREDDRTISGVLRLAIREYLAKREH